jgi:hypothetical protein
MTSGAALPGARWNPAIAMLPLASCLLSLEVLHGVWLHGARADQSDTQ